MIYSKLSRFYFVFLFVSICFGCFSKITNAGIHGKVATIEDIGKMLDEFKSYYKDSLFSKDAKTRKWAWNRGNKGPHNMGFYKEEDALFLEECRRKSNSNDLFGDEALKYLSNPVVKGEEFNCRNISSWCFRWLESRNFICGLLFSNLHSKSEIKGFRWCVIVPVLDSAKNLDMYVCEFNRYRSDGYTRVKVLFHWHSFFYDVSWINFVIVKNNEIYNHIPGCIQHEHSAVSAPIWVWNVMKSLSGRGRLALSARNWLQKYSARVISDLSKNKIDLSIWPYIMPCDKAKQFDRKTVGKISGGILWVPSITDSNFSIECFPESRWTKVYNVCENEKEEMGLDDNGIDWEITRFYLCLKDLRFALKDGFKLSPKCEFKFCRLPNSLKPNNCVYFKPIDYLHEKQSKEIVQSTLCESIYESIYGQEEISDSEINLGEEKTSPKEFFNGDEVYFELLTPQPNEIFVRSDQVKFEEGKSKECRKIICRSESARKYDVKFIDDCYSIKSDPERENKGK